MDSWAPAAPLPPHCWLALKVAMVLCTLLLLCLASTATFGDPEALLLYSQTVRTTDATAWDASYRVGTHRSHAQLPITPKQSATHASMSAARHNSPAGRAALPTDISLATATKPMVKLMLCLMPVLAALTTALAWMQRRARKHVLADLQLPFAMATASGFMLRKVAVTGAAGRTGRLVVEKLLKKGGFVPICVVKGEKGAAALRKIGVPQENIRICSVTDESVALAEVFYGCDSVILCTSAVPKLQPLSILKIFLNKCLCRKPGRPTFTFPEGGTPEEVDWVGTRNQVDAAKMAGVKHFVMVSSMGGTEPENFLNTIGRKPDGTGGNILLWKRKGERYLIGSGLNYTIIHPGGLLDAEGGKRELVFGVDDTLLTEKVRSIPRADVAEVCIQALVEPKAINRSFDIISRPEGQGLPTIDFADFFSRRGNCNYNNM